MTPQTIAPDPFAALAPPMRWLLLRCTPDEPALAHVQPTATLGTLYDAWMKHEFYESAIRLITSVLPARESIWWAWVSARHATQMEGGVPATDKVHTALTAIEQWVVRPDDDARRRAWKAGEAAGLETPVGMVSAAVFLNGTTLGEPGTPVVPPPPGVAMPLVSGAILLAGVSSANPDIIPVTLSAFAAQGLEIVKRLGGWDAALTLAHETHIRQQDEYTRATMPASTR